MATFPNKAADLPSFLWTEQEHEFSDSLLLEDWKDESSLREAETEEEDE